MKVRQIVRELLTYGCTKKSIAGDHGKYIKENRTVIVPLKEVHLKTRNI